MGGCERGGAGRPGGLAAATVEGVDCSHGVAGEEAEKEEAQGGRR